MMMVHMASCMGFKFSPLIDTHPKLVHKQGVIILVVTSTICGKLFHWNRSSWLGTCRYYRHYECNKMLLLLYRYPSKFYIGGRIIVHCSLPMKICGMPEEMNPSAVRMAVATSLTVNQVR